VNQDRVDELLGFGKYRKTLMALKWLRWELERLVKNRSIGLGEES
jgi:hypothetical protein